MNGSNTSRSDNTSLILTVLKNYFALDFLLFGSSHLYKNHENWNPLTIIHTIFQFSYIILEHNLINFKMNKIMVFSIYYDSWLWMFLLLYIMLWWYIYVLISLTDNFWAPWAMLLDLLYNLPLSQTELCYENYIVI